MKSGNYFQSSILVVCVCARVCRLSAGVLYILWLQIKQRPGGLQVHRAVHSALQGLIATDVSVRGTQGRAVITSLSTAGTVAPQ